MKGKTNFDKSFESIKKIRGKLTKHKMTKSYRILDGTLFKWESYKEGEDSFIKITKVCDLVYDNKPVAIENFAEKFVEQLIKENKKIIYNLK